MTAFDRILHEKDRLEKILAEKEAKFKDFD